MMDDKSCYCYGDWFCHHHAPAPMPDDSTGDEMKKPATDSRAERDVFDEALTRYLLQGYLDTMDDPLDEYGKRIVRRLQTLYRAASVPEGQ